MYLNPNTTADYLSRRTVRTVSYPLRARAHAHARGKSQPFIGADRSVLKRPIVLSVL